MTQNIVQTIETQCQQFSWKRKDKPTISLDMVLPQKNWKGWIILSINIHRNVTLYSMLSFKISR